MSRVTTLTYIDVYRIHRYIHTYLYTYIHKNTYIHTYVRSTYIYIHT
jgi:hypothetical protein